MNIAIILAAGLSTRFKSQNSQGLCKQYYRFNGKPILYYSIKHFYEISYFDKVIVVVRKEALDYNYPDILGDFPNIDVVLGCISRLHSVLSALKFINSNQYKCENVLIHDASRPLVSKKLIYRVINACTESRNNIIPIIKVTDSVVVVTNNELCDIVDRTYVYKVQTPQLFTFQILQNCYQKILKNKVDLKNYKDDSSILKDFGYNVSVVPGEVQNIKITFEEDLLFLKLLKD